MPQSTRRDFIKLSALVAGSSPLLGHNSAVQGAASAPTDSVSVAWLEQADGHFSPGATCGVFWPRGKVPRESHFSAITDQKKGIDSQSWPLAYWPDGTLKWTAHAFNSAALDTQHIRIKPQPQPTKTRGMAVDDKRGRIIVDTGVIRCVVNKKGTVLIESIFRNNRQSVNRELVKNGKLMLLVQNAAEDSLAQSLTREQFDGEISTVALEHAGPIRTVIKIEGKHRSQSRKKSLIPFVLRLYFYRDSEAIRVMHTMIYDGDENTDFIKGLGLTFELPLEGEMYNRHIRFPNSEHQGVFAEAVQGLTGLRRNPGDSARAQQIKGKRVGAVNTLSERVQKNLHYVPTFGDYSLFQGNSTGFSIRKRTDAKQGWIGTSEGKRASGLVYLGTPSGGLVAGIRNFWQSYPAQLDIRDANTPVGKIDLWLWAPSAAAMDLRFYHDGLGQDTHAKQLDALDITYEDYEPGFATAKGVARTSELMLWVTADTPSNEHLSGMAETLQNPPTLMCDTAYLAEQQVFGGNWQTEDRSSPEKETLENHLDYYFEYYQKQVDQHHWYGFWHYGDFMHTYDSDRHTWRYDVGGYAWDNSELSTDLWLWYYFLHSKRLDVYRIAEAMTRHTGEVDVYHLGPFAPLGSRHNVMHWGCSAKQMRISTAANRRIYYFLTGDERVGDLMDEQVDAAKKLVDIIPERKLPRVAEWRNNPPSKGAIPLSFGTDWGAVAAAWLTHWERTGDPETKGRLLNSMSTIGKQPKGFFTGRGWMDFESGKFSISKSHDVSVSHLSAVFGLAEVCEELILLVDVPEFSQAWIQYCRLYNASAEEQKTALGQEAGRLNLKQGHSRLTAYAAHKLKDEQLADRAWREFFSGIAGIKPENRNTKRISGSAVLNPVDEDISISTNAVAQWGLAALQNLAYVGKHLGDS